MFFSQGFLQQPWAVTHVTDKAVKGEGAHLNRAKMHYTPHTMVQSALSVPPAPLSYESQRSESKPGLAYAPRDQGKLALDALLGRMWLR